LQDTYRKAQYLLFHDIRAKNKTEPGRPQKTILRPNISLQKKRRKRLSRYSRIKKRIRKKGKNERANALNVLYHINNIFSKH